MRAELVTKRRNAAAAMTTDLDLEMQDLQVSLELDSKDYPPADLATFRKAVERATAIMAEIYNDVTALANNPVPERITDVQGYELTQPALRIEARAVELRRVLEKARQARTEVNKPREEANGVIAEAERHRLQAEIEMSSVRAIAEELKTAYAENYPTVEAAMLTANSEMQAATQMVTSARLAMNRKSWREAVDLARRAGTVFTSAASKFELVRLSQADYSHAEKEADDALAAALRQLNTARTVLMAQASTLIYEANHYLSPAVQRVGEARRAFKANPPQYVTALRLAKEAQAMIEQSLSLANEEASKIQQSRMDARQSLQQLQEAVHNLRVNINYQRTVPVKANAYYDQARAERDRLLPRQAEIDKLSIPQLVELTMAARQALQKAQEGLKLVGA